MTNESRAPSSALGKAFYGGSGLSQRPVSALSEACISVSDRGLFGDSIYEVARAWVAGLALDRHLERLRRVWRQSPSPAWIGIRCENMVGLSARRRRRRPDLRAITRVAPRRTCRKPLVPTVLITVRPVEDLAARPRGRGLGHPRARGALATARHRRPTCCQTSWRSRNARGAYGAIRDRRRLVNEGSSANLFIVQAGLVRTPPTAQPAARHYPHW